MEVAIMTRLFAKRDVDVDSAHSISSQWSVFLWAFKKVNSAPVFSLLIVLTTTEHYFFTRSSFCLTKASQPE